MIDFNNVNGEHNYNLGGKANSLIKLKKLGLPIPDFFVIPASYFEEYTRSNRIYEEIKKLLKECKYEEIKQKIMEGSYTENMTREILGKLEENDFLEYSVRSSANNEDGKIKSFAGQYETFLNVKKGDVLNSIKKCWVSILEDNVVSYVEEEINIYSVNVIIQKMINPELAGVAFSVDPTSRSKNYSIIEMCEGVGEKLVSGQTTPTRLAVRRDSMEVDLKVGNINMPTSKIKELEQYILYIEESYGYPIDMEWCYLNNEIYILQARPITAYNYVIIPFEKAISREKKLFEIEIYYSGEYFGIKELALR